MICMYMTWYLPLDVTWIILLLLMTVLYSCSLTTPFSTVSFVIGISDQTVDWTITAGNTMIKIMKSNIDRHLIYLLHHLCLVLLKLIIGMTGFTDSISAFTSNKKYVLIFDLFLHPFVYFNRHVLVLIIQNIFIFFSKTIRPIWRRVCRKNVCEFLYSNSSFYLVQTENIVAMDNSVLSRMVSFRIARNN